MFPVRELLTKPTALLPGGRDVETLDPPKYRTAAGRHYQSVPAHFKLDVRWGPTGVPQEESRCEPTWSRRYLPRCLHPVLSSVPSYLISLGDSATYTLVT